MMTNRRIGISDYSQVNPWSVAETGLTVAKLEFHTLCLLSSTIYTKVNAITLIEDEGLYRAMMEVKDETPLTLKEALAELQKES